MTQPKRDDTPSDTEFMRMAAAAAYAKLSPQTLRRMAAARRLRVLRPTARTVVIERRELDRLLRGE
jgi:hypothetical protein